MLYKNVLTQVSLVFAEVCFFSFLYGIVIDYLKTEAAVASLFFFAVAGFTAIVNLFLASKRLRIFTILIVNILSISALVLLTEHFMSGIFLFATPGVVPVVRVLLLDLILLWLIIRSVYLVYKNPFPNVYTHFDLYIFLSLSVLIVSEFAGVNIESTMLWIMTVFFFNLLPLYLAADREKASSPLKLPVVTIAALIAILISNKGLTLLPRVSGTAGSMFDQFSGAFLFIISLFANAIVFLVSFSKGGAQAAAEGQGNNAPVQAGNFVESTMPKWVDLMLKGLLILVCLILAMVFIYILYVVARMLFSKLMIKRGGISRGNAYNPFPEWCRKIRAIILKIKSIRFYDSPVTVFLPGKRNMNADRAYKLLLKWGTARRKKRISGETPYEYARRLTAAYPLLGYELSEITNSFVEFCYSDGNLLKLQCTNLKKALRRIFFYRFAGLFKKSSDKYW